MTLMLACQLVGDSACAHFYGPFTKLQNLTANGFVELVQEQTLVANQTQNNQNAGLKARRQTSGAMAEIHLC